MRVTTAFNRLLKIPGASVTHVEIGEREVLVSVRLRARRLRCPCGLESRATYDRSVRKWRHMDAAEMKVWIVAPIRRLDCPGCGVRTEMVPWARPNARHTRSFEDQVAWLAQRMDRTSVSKLMRCSWEAVRAIIGRIVADNLSARRFEGLTRIGVDEICYRRPNRYLTLVADHERRRVVWVSPGKDKQAFTGFFDALGERRCAKIEAVAMDMGTTFIAAARERVPQADICFDPFHVMQWANAAMDETLKAVPETDPSVTMAQRRKIRWAVRKGAERLSPAHKELINQMRRTRYRAFRAWELKEELRDLYRHVDPANARDYLDDWCDAAVRSRIQGFVLLARRIRKHFDGIIAAIRHQLTNALGESINSKIRLINARGYGHHSAQALTQMIYLCCGGIKVKLPTET